MFSYCFCICVVLVFISPLSLLICLFTFCLKEGSTCINQCDTSHQQTKVKNHMIISIDSEKALDKIQHPFMIKILTKVQYRGNKSQNNQRYLWQTHSQHNTQWWKAVSLPTKIWNKTRMPLLFNTALEVLTRAIRQEKKKVSKLEEVKLSHYMQMTWYSTSKTLKIHTHKNY